MRWPVIVTATIFVIVGAVTASPLVTNAKTVALDSLTVTRERSLHFGRLAADPKSNGKAIIRPKSGKKLVRGGVVDLGGAHHRAEFTVEGSPGTAFLIVLPNRLVVRGQDGSRSKAIVKNLKSFPAKRAVLGRNGKVTVYVGATLRVQAAQPADSYKGSFTIQVFEP